MRIAMIGSGYVGLVSGACFSDFGHEVVCVDTNADKIESLKQGRIPIFEPGLQALVAQNSRAGRLSFTTDLKSAVAAAEIAQAMDGFTVVVTKSTVPVGTGDRIEAIIREANPAADFAVVSNP